MIALLGATGRIGRHVAAGLAQAGTPVLALVRDPANADLPVPVAHADLADPATLPAALAGCERLFLLTPHGPAQDVLERTAIDAAVTAGVAHVVKVSGGAATLGPNGPTPTAVAHWRSERRIEEAGVTFDLLRPAFLMQNLLESLAPTVARTGVLAHPLGHAPIAMVDARDVADAAVAALLRPVAARGAWTLTGPRAVPLADVAARVGARHRPTPVAVAARALARAGATPWEVTHAVRMAAFLSAGGDSAATGDVERLTGRPPRTIEAFLDEHLDAFRPTTGLARLLSRPTPSDSLQGPGTGRGRPLPSPTKAA